MARKKPKVKKLHSTHAAPGTLLFFLDPYLEHRRVKHYSKETVKHDGRFLMQFITWASERGVEQAAEVTRNILDGYQRYLYHYRMKNGKPLSH